MRRLPVYFLLDTTGPMRGENIHGLNDALNNMINTLRCDAHAVDLLWISIITYDREVKEIVPLTELVSFQLQEIVCSQSGPRNTGKALNFLINTLELQEVVNKSKQDFTHKPLIILVTVREPNDEELFLEMSSKLIPDKYGIKIAYIMDKSSDIGWIKPFSDMIIIGNQNHINCDKQFFRFTSELILKILEKVYFSNDTINSDITQFLKMPSQLTYINL